MASGIGSVLKLIGGDRWIAKKKQRDMMAMHRDKRLRVGLRCSIANAQIGMGVFFGDHVSFHNSQIGDHSYINANTYVKNTRIGKYCSIASGVKIVLGAHPTDFVTLHPAFYANNKPIETFADAMYFDEAPSVTIGNDVWIGEDAVVVGGVNIGDGAVIAARAVVTKDIQPYAVVGGVPAKFIKLRFEQTIVNKLMSIHWWDMDEAWLRDNFKLMHDPLKFITHFEKSKPIH